MVTRDQFDFVSIHYPFNKPTAIKIWVPELYEKYVRYIQRNSLREAEIVMPSLTILNDCPTLRYLKVCPYAGTQNDYDFSPLYDRKILYLHCRNRYGDRMNQFANVDFSRIDGLESLSLEANRGAINYNRIETIKSLIIGNFTGKDRDLTDLFVSTELDTLRMMEGKTVSLNGIERAKKMQYLALSYNRSLEDISALAKIKHSLKSLNIFNCAKIKDFSVLYELENLEKLEIWGSNTLPNLDFVKYMPNLKTLFLMNNIADGDLTPCLNLRSAKVVNKKHYNLKDKDLPKAEKVIFGNESIEEWRRLE